MKLLFDQNISPKLIQHLKNIFPEAKHISELDMASSSDTIVWNYAKSHDFVVVSKDADFAERVLLYGAPPKVIWIRRGNCSTSDIKNILQDNVFEIRNFIINPKSTLLNLF